MELNRSAQTVTAEQLRVIGGDDVARAASGDAEAFTRLVAAHHADMLRLAGTIVGDPEAARDVAQIAWQRAWTGLSSLRDQTRVRAWLLTIVANEARQALRRRPTGTAGEGELSAFPDPETYFQDIDLHAALDRLSPLDRELLGLRYVLGYNSTELGAHMGLSPAGVRTRLKKVVERLRSELTDD